MPTFSGIEVDATVSVDLDFEVYCAKCGAGICGLADVKKSRNRGFPIISMTPCEKCMEEKDGEIADLTKERDALDNQVDELKYQLQELEKEYAKIAN